LLTVNGQGILCSYLDVRRFRADPDRVCESTVNLVVSRRFAKRQPMQWSEQGPQLPLHTRIRTLIVTLHDLFTRWYPAMPANDVQATSLAAVS
jgi:hypothetical protein